VLEAGLGRWAWTRFLVPRAHVARQLTGEGIRPEQRQHARLALEKALEQRVEPALRARGPQRREPHLPVQSRHVRLLPGGQAREIVRLPRQRVALPRAAVRAALDLDLAPLGGHHAEEAVAVERAEGSERALGARGGRGELQPAEVVEHL